MAENWASVRVDEEVAAAEAAAADVLSGVQLPAPERSAQEKRPVLQVDSFRRQRRTGSCSLS